MILVVASSLAELQSITREDYPALVAVSVGVGLVQAAIGTYEAVMYHAPDHVVGIGTCCGVGIGCDLGDIILPSQVIQYTMDLRRFRLRRGEVFTADGSRTGFLPVDMLPGWPQQGVQSCEDRSIRDNTRMGSADQFFTPEKMLSAPWIRDELALDAIDMESYAMVAASRRAGVPVTIIRTISDLHDRTRVASLPAFLTESSRIIRELILRYSEPREKSPIIL